MNYIKQLKFHRDKLVDFYNSYCELDDAHKKVDTTAYKGDAQNAVKAAYQRLTAARKDVEINVIASIKQEEVRNG